MQVDEAGLIISLVPPVGQDTAFTLCVSTAFVAKTLPLPCVSAAFMG